MKYKDPTTGEFKELKIRATDELPVGSEIDVDDNTTIPAGWEEIDDPNVYSTEEKVIGKWITGKPLYRKVVSMNFASSGTYITTDHHISNIDEITYYYGKWYDTTDKAWYTNYKDIGRTHYVYVSSVTTTSIIVEQSNMNWQTRTANRYCVIEYTKTTD